MSELHRHSPIPFAAKFYSGMSLIAMRNLEISLTIQDTELSRQPAWPLSRPRTRRLIAAALPANCYSAALTLVLVGRAHSRRLNQEYRGRDYATNILTFTYTGLPQLHADLVFCHPVVTQEARAQKRSVDHHAAHLLVHGVLHACGLDHDRASDAAQMESLEIAILKRFRIPNPYR